MTILLAAGERVPVDGRIVDGRSELDCSVVTGESAPAIAEPGALVQAGSLNLSSPLTMIATAVASDSFFARMTRLIETAEAGRIRYRRIADRAASLYAPVVHCTAALAFVGWLVATGDVHRAATIAIAVLIITCPCALGLAVPMVQAIAARRLFENGILLKNGSGLERLVEVDTVVFDKTGTLTSAVPRLLDPVAIDPDALQIAAAIGGRSHHPYSRALAALRPDASVSRSLTNLTEHPGCGMEATIGADTYRLGNPAWAIGKDTDASAPTSVVLARNGRRVASFDFEDELRLSTAHALDLLRASNLSIEILSGDRRDAVQPIADALGVPFRAQVDPAGKIAHIEQLQARGRNVLMVGDGINDAPALAAAYVSIAPGSAADIGRAAADFVFLRDSLLAVPQALSIARSADRLVRQNLWIAVLYNAVSVPLAIFGLVTPLIAAVAMSLSSLTVVANSLRLRPAALRRQELARAPELATGRLGLEGSSNG
jgi:Cu2+-exporting ATPase